MEKLYTDSKNKTGSWLWLRPWAPYCKIQLKLKKVGKTIRPFRYDLNQIPYDYTVEVMNRFKGLYLIEYLKYYRWRFITLYRRWWPKPFPRKRNGRRQSGCLKKFLQITEDRREVKGKGEEERHTQLKAESQRIATRDKKPFWNVQCKGIEENNGMGKISSRKLEISRQHFIQGRTQ